ncbi:MULTISPECIES: 4-oxalocrotonate tautomerase family protein [unclassified Streptomyces]|uniref:tautomerase family protein n=1 Tax=unclassified Streptomyces TaxID=2593676 RepID=UPI0036C37D4B
MGDRSTVPYVNVKITREGATADQKAAIIAGVTDLLVKVLDKDPATTFVLIDEVDLEDWGVGGVPTLEYRRRARS